MNKLCHDRFLDKYNPRSSFWPYNTRNSHHLQTPMHRIEHYKKSFPIQPVKDWNTTPINVRELRSLNTHKRQLKMYLKNTS